MRTPRSPSRRRAARSGGSGFTSPRPGWAAAALAVCGVLVLACQPTRSAGQATDDGSPDDRATAPTPSDSPADEHENDSRSSGDSDAPEPGTEPTDLDGEPADAPASDGEGDDERAGERIPYVDEDHAQYSRVEGTAFDNDCETDEDCHVGGCSSEVCSAEPGVTTTCEMPASGWASSGGTCGCVEGTCKWYKVAGESKPPQNGNQGEPTRAEGRSPHALEGQGEACRDGACPDPLDCVTYYGVAGTKGPEFSSCEIPCPGGSDEPCPDEQTCVAIADGPGEVCRARPE